MASELSSIPGLLPKHVALLSGTLQITTARQLAGADTRVIHAAMRRLRPAPTLAAISAWQDHARELAGSRPARPVKAGKARQTGWEQAAAFVVSFETRGTGGDQDRRLVVEQVEQAPPEPRQEWPGWGTESAWAWMLDRARPNDDTDDESAPKGEQNSNPLSNPPARSGRSRKGSAALRQVPPTIKAGIPELALADGAVRRLDAGGRAVDVPPHATLRVSATCEQGMKLHVALRLRRADAAASAPVPPVTVVSGKTAEIDLRDMPPGEHTAVLAVWAARGAAAAAIVPLPRLRVPGP